jgi:hypothetical protein
MEIHRECRNMVPPLHRQLQRVVLIPTPMNVLLSAPLREQDCAVPDGGPFQTGEEPQAAVPGSAAGGPVAGCGYSAADKVRASRRGRALCPRLRPALAGRDGKETLSRHPVPMIIRAGEIAGFASVQQ